MEHSLRRAGVANDIIYQEQGGPIDAVAFRPHELTLGEAVRLTLETDPQVQAAIARVRIAEAEDDQQRLLPNPILSIVARFPENSGKPIIDADLGFELIELLQKPGQIAAADHRLRGACSEVVSVVLDQIAEVEERYANVQSFDAQMPVLDEQRALITRLLDLARDRLNKGEGTQLDVLTLETQELDLEVDVSEKRLQRRQERLALAQLLGEPNSKADWTLAPWSAPPAAAEESRWITAALARRPEVESQQWELAALGVERDLARFSPFDQVEVGSASERDSEWSVGPAIAFPIPLFDWGQARRAKTAAAQSEASHKLAQVRRTVVSEVRSAYTAYVESIRTQELARDRLVPAQQRRRRDTEAAYLAGQADITAVILADEDLEAARLKLIEVQERVASALTKLQRAVGGPGVASTLEAAPAVTATAPASRPATVAAPATVPATPASSTIPTPSTSPDRKEQP